jgi:glutamate synthase domain-containing protein 3
VYDVDCKFIGRKRFHSEFIDPKEFADCDFVSKEALRALIVQHAEESGSSLAQRMLADWPVMAGAFVRLSPKSQV